MSAFSEYFMMIKNRRNLTGAQIAEMCDKETGMIFHWLSGKRYPSEWSLMEDVVEKLKLSEDEYRKLKNAYERTILGESDYVCHKKIMEIFHLLEDRRDAQVVFPEEKYIKVQEVCLPEFKKLNGKMEILVWLQTALEYLSLQRHRKLYLKFQNKHEEVLLLLKMLCSRIHDCQMEEIVYLCREKNISNIENLEVLKGIIEILVQKNSIDVYYLEELDYEKGFAENWILSDDFVILYDAELTSGMLTANRDWIDTYKESFEKLKQISESFGKKECGYFQDESGYEMPDSMGISMEYMPSVRQCPGMEWKSFFSGEGYIEFMENGSMEKYSHLKTRCEIMQMCIDNAKNGRFQYFMIKDSELPEMQNLCIRQISGKEKKLVICMLFEEGMQERFEIKDEGLQQQFWNFFEYLEKYGYIYNAEETLAYMESVLWEYKKRL